LTKGKANILILISILVITLVFVIFFIMKKDSPNTSPSSELDNSEETYEENNHNNKENKDEIDEEPTLTSPFSKYKYYGEKCLNIDPLIERGDCFQELAENYLTWDLDEDKSFFPYKIETDDQEKDTKDDQDYNIFSMEVEKDDRLSEIFETNYFDLHGDRESQSDTIYDKGKRTLENHWHVISNIIPSEYRESLKKLYYRDKDGTSFLAVGYTEGKSSELALLISENISEKYSPSTRFILLHEFGHILTTNDQEVDIYEGIFEEGMTDEVEAEAIAQCETVYSQTRCAKEDSYLYDYYKDFWQDINEEFEAIDWYDEKGFENFFFDHEEHFFNSYQGTNILEDIATSFAFFIYTHSDVRKKPEIKYQKINFFYNYDELIELRTAILENLYHLSVEDEIIY